MSRSYDTLGRVERTIDNAVNGLFTATEPITDRITLYQYDHFSRGITTTLNYDPPTLGSRTDTNRVSVSAYDPLTMRALGQRDPLGRWVSQQYDLLGRATRRSRTAAMAATRRWRQAVPALPTMPDRNVPATTAL